MNSVVFSKRSSCIKVPFLFSTQFVAAVYLLVLASDAIESLVFTEHFGRALANENVVSTLFGVTAMEHGDDRFKFGCAGLLSVDHYQAKVFYVWDNFGPVYQSSLLFAASRGYTLSLLKNLYGSVGVSGLVEKTVINYQVAQHKNVDEKALHLGANFSVFFKRPVYRRLNIAVGWDATVFPAGLNGAIFLASGRKQFFYILAGYQW